MQEIWILGATGRSGRAVARQLAKVQLVQTKLAQTQLAQAQSTQAQFAVVLVGRDGDRLRELAGAIHENDNGVRIVTAGSIEAIVKELARNRPAVVINTIGPFNATALPIARACQPGTHYLDISNEPDSIVALLALHDEAVASGRTIVTAAGFGVLATESVVLKLCAGQPPALRVCVDALPVVEPESGRLGEALAATIIGASAGGGLCYANGRLARTRALGDPEVLTLPDGSSALTACGPLGDLIAAHRASGASYALAASSYAPSSAVLRALLPPLMTLLRINAVRNFAIRRLAAVELKPKPPTAQQGPGLSWTHARVQWADGATREGWLRLGDAMIFTTAVMVEVASRLARNEGRPGAYTPGALFGPNLAVSAGGQFILDLPSRG